MKILLRNISKQLGLVHLQVNTTLTGRAIGICGPSGAGKTSLLEIIAGLKKPDSALVQIGDHVLENSSQKIRISPQHRRIGYVPQDLALFPHLTVQQNLAYGAKPQTEEASAISQEHIIEVLEIKALLPRGIAALSGGEKQRVAFARALMSSPRLLLLDEPLASLDRELKDKILVYLAKVRDEFSIPMIYVSHDPREIQSLCDEVLLMMEGRIESQGTPEEMFLPR